LVALGHVSALPPQPRAEISPLGPETASSSQHEVDYPLMREMHAASSLHTADEVHRWRGGTPLTRFPPPAGQVAQLQPRPVTRIGPGAGRGRRRGHIFLGRLAAYFAALRKSWIPRGAA